MKINPIYKSIFITGIILSSIIPAFSQKRITSPNGESFKRWLSYSWLKESVVYDTVETVNNKVVLTLRLICSEDCTDKFRRLKSSFDSLTSLSFEEYLWTKAQFHLEVEAENLIVEIYNKPKPLELPCFLRAIQMKEAIDIVKADCKDLGGQASINYDRFNPIFLLRKKSYQGMDKQYGQIIDSLYSKAERFYKSKGKEVEVIINKKEPHRLVLTVENLSNEVVKGRKTTEKIRITIMIVFHEKYVSFETILNGKVGSGKYKPVSDKGYYDMEDDNTPEFQRYVDDFTNNKIPQWLK